jgi:hypothetical protein
VSSAGVDKQRLSRADNRKRNHALHVIALSISGTTNAERRTTPRSSRLVKARAQD